MSDITTKQASNRILYFDILRVVAILGVIILHVASSNWYDTDVSSFEWLVFNIEDSIVRWCVPIFVMISGALFLKEDISIRKLYSKYILRIVTAFIVWSIIYALVELPHGASLVWFCHVLISGHYHMWFLYMIAGLYIIVPFIRCIVKSQSLTKYFLILSLIFSFIIPQFINLLAYISPEISLSLDSIVGKMHFHFVLGYAGYFVLGYYLNEFDIPRTIRRIIYLLGIIGFVATAYGTLLISLHINAPNGDMYEYCTLNVLFEALAVFVFFKYNTNICEANTTLTDTIFALSKYSFGVYLVHPLIIETLKKFGIDTLMCNPIISTMLIIFVVCCVSFAISWVCNHIPVLKKYIV